MEYQVRRQVREDYGLGELVSRGDAEAQRRGFLALGNIREVREFAFRLTANHANGIDKHNISAGDLQAVGLINEIILYILKQYLDTVQPDAFEKAHARLEEHLDPLQTAHLLSSFDDEYPPEKRASLNIEGIFCLALSNLNPAFEPFRFLFDDRPLAEETVYPQAVDELKAHFKGLPPLPGGDGKSLWDMLREPALAAPNSLRGQLEYIAKNWRGFIGEFLDLILSAMDVIAEEQKPHWFGGPPGPMDALTFEHHDDEYEKFSQDKEWMPKTVLMAKSTLVWLWQLTQKYEREIHTLDAIPDEELDELSRRGFTGLWLIGLWERSNASRTIKQWKGNPEAAASAYSLYDYDIAEELGGWPALNNLKERCARRGIRLGSDMVPNHTGLDSRWIMEHPDRFLQLDHPPYPQYQYGSGNLSNNDNVVVQIEDHYYNNTDCAVVFHYYNKWENRHRYIYHGNDGTSMPWNDTAQIDFLNPEAREAVIQTIVGVCRQFPIVRFDAAMTLAKRHIQRLWYPLPGHGGDIASRAEHAMSDDEFNKRIPNEFWREVVDRCAVEAPNTLLLAEAFWMMEGYFVRTLGMHRVYNSAFMNMLKMEDNAKYRATIKNTIAFEPEILQRFVNFMNNPDEDTAVAQFGKGDKYFGVATLLVTMPGLPMIGHGQIEGFEEKYGMEYRRAYRDEKPDEWLVKRHEKEIFPLMKKRYLFAGAQNFVLYDFMNANNGTVNENVFAYSNMAGGEKALVLYNNKYENTAGWVKGITSALLLHEGADWFTLMYEMHAGLWYVRSSKQLAEEGLFCELQGYGCQVFMDIHDANGEQYAKLNNELKGRGVPSLEAAWQDLEYGDLYWEFEKQVKEINDGNGAAITVGANNYSPLPDITVYLAALQAFLKTQKQKSPYITKIGLDRKLREKLPPEMVGAMLYALDHKKIDLKSEAFQKLIGMNEYDGINWFNKEAFEAALENLPQLLPITKTDIAKYKKAETQSEYKYDVLVELLKPKKGKAKNDNKKPKRV
ncbi:MAG: alpha-amylase [Spirochaetaceae bacterium]|jgi:glycosidase|nr:alpha-amylase [Spirochaetaceae bacterium]